MQQPSVRDHLSLTRSDDVESVERIVMKRRGRIECQDSRRNSTTILNKLTLKHTHTYMTTHTYTQTHTHYWHIMMTAKE